MDISARIDMMEHDASRQFSFTSSFKVDST